LAFHAGINLERGRLAVAASPHFNCFYVINMLDRQLRSLKASARRFLYDGNVMTADASRVLRTGKRLA
jgi:hypothetical protein